MPSFLDKVFASLEHASITYCVLRGFEELEIPAGNSEVDLLLAPEHLALLARVLAQHGFVALPAWGHAPHHFFLAYDRAADAWLKLDVVTALRYGAPFRTLRLDLAEACLRRRQRRAGTYVLSPADEFITLLLHCLLDKGNFREARRDRLVALWRLLSGDETLAAAALEHCERYLAPALSWDVLAQTLKGQDWQVLLQQRDGVARRLWRLDPAGSALRQLATLVLRRLRPFLFALRQRGLSVALLAPDGAGKSTLARELTRDDFLRAQLIYMGTNIDASTVGLPTTRWLHERLKARNGAAKKTRLPRVMLKALAFVNRLAEQWYRAGAALNHLLRGRLVVFDRYIYDSWLNRTPATAWKRLRRKLFEAICPRPDLVILLDAPGQLLYDRKHEHSPEWLEKQRRAYLALREHLPQMRVVDATQQAQQVKREVTEMIWNQRRLSG